MYHTLEISQGSATYIAAEAFADGIIRLVRSRQIHTVELLSATECYSQEHKESEHLQVSEVEVEAARGIKRNCSSVSDPAFLLVEARLTSALNWKHDATNSRSDEKFLENNGSIFTYQIYFLLPRSTASSGTLGKGYTNTSFPFSSSTRTVLSAWWCADLQRRLAICSALTGFPTCLFVSLLPYVPHLTWERGRDGLLGATHSATMMSTITEKELYDYDSPAAHILQVALLLNANIPLGARGRRNTAVLVLHAVEGDACFANSSLSFVPSERKKHPRELKQDEGLLPENEALQKQQHQQHGESEKEWNKEQLFLTLSRFTEKHIIPLLLWQVVWSKPLVADGDDMDVCGIRKQMGSSFYLEGTLDARSVQSITVIIDVPLALCRYILLSDTSSEFGLENNILQRLAQRVAYTVEGALSRLAAENIDCFVRRPTTVLSEEEMDEEAENDENEGAAREEVSIEKTERRSWLLLAQSIADSLAQILRTSKNPVFIAEVHRLLLLHQKEEVMSLSTSNNVKDDNMAATAAGICPSSAATTAAMLRWAVETRLMEC
ncbi:uncharacterized protein TM35_000011420 [Trypanosoma theileri]|uniref:Uncharacterized protein n=1 Tax=Trypanosoma theileri TaxID=67003 RepID=A0A1X0P8W4_9TRYP|nr:uncharacterized protein TM35_000011420 [Trypanosoma theileri]ORC93265.1 hypothetical protein TM35_000011420 [Trypanosoma theileri]